MMAWLQNTGLARLRATAVGGEEGDEVDDAGELDPGGLARLRAAAAGGEDGDEVDDAGELDPSGLTRLRPPGNGHKRRGGRRCARPSV